MNVMETIEFYLRKYNINDAEISEIYSLYPENGAYGWPQCWPYHNKCGVYIIFDCNMVPLYIGEASIVARRLSNYFKYAADGSCLPKQEWLRTPCYLQVVSVKMDYERFSLEAYLISTLKPDNNIKGL